MQIIQTETLAGFTAEIVKDNLAESPRDINEELGTLALIPHPDRRVGKLGDEHPFKTMAEIWAHIKATRAAKISVYVRADWNPEVSTIPGRGLHLGYIFCPAEKVKEEYGEGPEAAKAARRYMRGEVEEYGLFLQGEVYGYRIFDPAGEEIDSCWGFYGLEYITQEVRRELLSEVERAPKVPAAA